MLYVVDICASIESLVAGRIKLGDVLDLKSGVLAWAQGRVTIFNRDASMAEFKIAEGQDIDQCFEVVVRLGV